MTRIQVTLFDSNGQSTAPISDDDPLATPSMPWQGSLFDLSQVAGSNWSGRATGVTVTRVAGLDPGYQYDHIQLCAGNPLDGNVDTISVESVAAPPAGQPSPQPVDLSQIIFNDTGFARRAAFIKFITRHDTSTPVYRVNLWDKNTDGSEPPTLFLYSWQGMGGVIDLNPFDFADKADSAQIPVPPYPPSDGWIVRLYDDWKDQKKASRVVDLQRKDGVAAFVNLPGGWTNTIDAVQFTQPSSIIPFRSGE
jgi:hypothetical protein